MRVATGANLTSEERAVLTKWSRSRSTVARLVLRAKIVLVSTKDCKSKGHRHEAGLRSTNRQHIAQSFSFGNSGRYSKRYTARRSRGNKARVAGG